MSCTHTHTQDLTVAQQIRARLDSSLSLNAWCVSLRTYIVPGIAYWSHVHWNSYVLVSPSVSVTLPPELMLPSKGLVSLFHWHMGMELLTIVC